MLISADRSCLLIVDVQEKLVPAIHDPERVIERCAWLMRLAATVDVPLLVSQQYPKGLGPTVPRLQELAPQGSLMDKVHFSCADSPECLARIEALDREQILVAGIEAHVCVLQTAIGLHDRGKQVFVVADAISSRAPRDAELALQRMAAAGVNVVSGEMALFEWAHRAGTETFRELSVNFLR